MAQNGLEYYGKYAEVLLNGQERILSELNRILDGITKDSEQFPIEHIRSRIKAPASFQEKMKRRGMDNDVRAGLTRLSDVIGVRIVTHFIGDVYSVLELLKQSDCWEILNIKDYISSPKPNGYRSLHVILRIPVEGSDLEHILFEIQIRTIAMDCWASLEHQLKYKKHINNTELIEEELKRCADEMASTDLSMQTIKEMIES